MLPDNFYWGSTGTHMHMCGCRQIRVIHMELYQRPANSSPQAKSGSLLFIHSPWAKSGRMGFMFLHDWERRKYKKKSSISQLHEKHFMTNKIKISVSITEVLMGHRHLHFSKFCLRLYTHYTVNTKLSSGDKQRSCDPAKHWLFLPGPL